MTMTNFPKLICLLVVGLSTTAAAGADLVWEHPTGIENPQALVVDSNHPHFLHAAIKEGGVKVLRIGGAQPREVAHIKKSNLADLDAMNLWQERSSLFVALGSFFDPKGSAAGLAIIDVSNPIRPRVRSTWKSEQRLRGSAIVVCDKKRQRAFLGVMEHGVMIFDIADPENPTHLTTFRPDPNFPRKNPPKLQVPNARGMGLHGDHLYVCYDAGGIRVLDISDAARPRQIGRYINRAMDKKPSAYNNIHIDGDIAYAAVDYAGLEILDIRDPQRIRQLGWWNPWKAETNANLWFNSPGHTNQIAFDRERKLVHMSGGDSELVSIDVSDPSKPELDSQHGEPKNGQGVWGLAAHGETVFLGYIRTLGVPFRGTWSGIRAVRR